MHSALTNAPVASFTTQSLRTAQHATGLMVKVAHLLPSRDLLSSQWQLRWTHTKGLAIWWQDVETSAMCYYQQQFQPTNIYEFFIVIFNFRFLISCGCGLTVIKYHHIAKPKSLAAE
jgi:hypothetical protein